jgi:hypothetical protein
MRKKIEALGDFAYRLEFATAKSQTIGRKIRLMHMPLCPLSFPDGAKERGNDF